MGQIKGESTTLVSVRISPIFKGQCDEKAKNEELSLNEWIRRAMASRLSGDDEFKSNRIRVLSHELEFVKSENDKLQCEIKHIQSENERIRSENERIRSENEHLNLECERLRSESARTFNIYNDYRLKHIDEIDNKEKIIEGLKLENKMLQEKNDSIFTEGSVDSNKVESIINSIIKEHLTEIHPNLLVPNEDVPKYFDMECPNCHVLLNPSVKICPVCNTDLSNLDEKKLRFNETAKKEARKNKKEERV